MDVHRFFVGWLLVAGLVGVYAQSDDEESSEKLTTGIAPRPNYRKLSESASALNPTNEDSSVATDVFGFVNEAGSRENSNPGGSTSSMSQEDYAWHFKEGEEVLRRLSDKTNTERANGGWLDPQMQSHDRRIPGNSMWDHRYPISFRTRIQAELAALERAVFDKREGQSIPAERVSEKELNKPDPSRLDTGKEKANWERLDRQREFLLASFVERIKNRVQSQQGYAESTPAINATFASLFTRTKHRPWTPEEKNILLEEFKEHIAAEKFPSYVEMHAVKEKHQLLRNRSVVSIRSWIALQIRNKHN